MRKLFSVPNLLSLGNLLCGCIGVMNAIDHNFTTVVFLLMIACVCDFLDGFAARGLKQGSPMGKELDSLADMVTFGVLPGVVMYQLIRYTEHMPDWDGSLWMYYLPYIGFLIPLFSGLRLAKFNVDDRQSDSFIGLPTLANALFICSLPMVIRLDPAFIDPLPIPKEDWGQGFMPNIYMAHMGYVPEILAKIVFSQVAMICITVLFSVLLISEIPMFSFKVKHVKWKGNEIRYIFLAIAIGLGVWLKLAALPLIIVVYIFMSVVYAIAKRSQAV